MKARAKKKGLRKRALRLFKSYLHKRYLKVMSQGKTSTLKEIFSSVPQGGKWSDFLFDLDISELADSLCGEAMDNHQILNEKQHQILNERKTDLKWKVIKS